MWPVVKGQPFSIPEHRAMPTLPPFQFPFNPSVGMYPLEVAISTCIGLRVLVKTGRFLGREGVIVSFADRKFIVRINEELEAFRVEDIEPVVTKAVSLDQSKSVSSPPSPSSPSSPLSPQPPQELDYLIPLAGPPMPKVRRMRRRGPRVNLVGKFVRIESGRYRGEAGYVCKGGNGYYSIKFSADSTNAHETVMKRSADLTLIPRPPTFVEGPDFAKAVAEAAAELKSSNRGKGSESENEEEESPKRRKRRKCSGISRDYWMERQVVVTAGKFRGEIGTVTRSGHGFYCVRIPGRGDVMKRATDIEVYDAQKEAAQPPKEKETIEPQPDPVPPVNTLEDEIRLAAGILLDLGRDGDSTDEDISKV